MTKEEHIKYWTENSLHDLESAEAIFNTGKNDWSLFISHLALEKMLKALWIKTNENSAPPKTHNLLKLAEMCKLKLSEDDQLFMLEVTSFNLEARYPDIKNDFREKCTGEFTENYLKRIKEFIKCIQEKT